MSRHVNQWCIVLSQLILGCGSQILIKLPLLFAIFRFTLHAVDSRGGHSESSFVSVRTPCPMVDDSRAEGILNFDVFAPVLYYASYILHLSGMFTHNYSLLKWVFPHSVHTVHH